MQENKERVALTSIAASGGLTIAKAVVGVLSGSLALLSEAAHSALDFAATVMTWYAVRIAGKPADEEHHYGHGKVESVSALIETGLLFVLSGVVILEAIKRLAGAEGHAVEATPWAFAVIVVSIVVDFFRARLLYRVAKETASEALEADALHFGSDMWSSLAVLAGLAAVAFGYPWADAAAAVTVHAIGGRLSISLDLEVDGNLVLGKAHEIADGLEAALRAELGAEVEIETHIEPLQTRGLPGRDAPNERVAAVREQLTAIAANIAFIGQIHDVRVRETAEGEIVNFHCHVDPMLTVQDVHERVDDVERALRRQFPTIKRVIGHAEPLG